MDLDDDFKIILYLTVGIIDALVYIPLIITILKNPFEAVKSNNFYSWLWWSFSGLIIFIYMGTVIKDTPATIISGMNFLSCFIILLILFYYKINIIHKIKKSFYGDYITTSQHNNINYIRLNQIYQFKRKKIILFFY